ncbi:MAG: 3'(2'),5'-bisphosphate nucleotidase CysQ [Burkholderiales bacterium]
MRSIDEGALQRLCDVARMAGREIMRHYGTTPACRQKADSSPVSIADVAAERVIVEALTAWDATIPIVAEESSMPSASLAAMWRRYWLVDPLDGTKEFLATNGEFTVNIALVDDGAPVLGVVLAPAFDLIYCAGRKLGAWRQRGGSRPERISSGRWRPGQPARVVESRSHPSPGLETFLASIDVVERVRLGSSLKFCRVAEGSADLYPRFGPMMEWDVAAGDCIYRNSAAAGERPSPLRYDPTDMRVAGFVLGYDTTAAMPVVTPA